jgi:hypothetical protein
VDRTAAILPWGLARTWPGIAAGGVELYLAHVKAAWDKAHPEAPLHQQSVVLTVPASFDEGARALTLEAAQMAGLPRVQLLEEPKAAFHDWLVLQGDELAAQLADSRLVLVVDVGGGTTDLTLVARVLNLSEWKIATTILFPSVLPYMLTGVPGRGHGLAGDRGRRDADGRRGHRLLGLGRVEQPQRQEHHHRHLRDRHRGPGAGVGSGQAGFGLYV